MAEIKRDSKGRFIKGSSGNSSRKFTSTRQPKNPGRKPSRFKELIAKLESVNAEPLSKEDFAKVVTHLLTLTSGELVEVAKNKNTPIAVIVVANALSGDIESKNMGNIDRMLDRVFGKAIVTQEITGKDGKDLMPEPITIEVIDNRDKADAKNSDDKDI